MENKLYYGDNLEILKKNMADESINLIYLDPPFNSNKDYNQIFKNEDGQQSEAQIKIFADTWYWNNEAEKLYFETIKFSGNDHVSNFLISMRELLGTNNMMAYLTMMAPRLLELHRVLKSDGVLFLHCDPSASHYLKLLLDAVFGYKNYINEIVWGYRQGGRGEKSFARKHDIIFFYSKSNNYNFYPDNIRVPYHGTGGYQKSGKGIVSKSGKVYMPNPNGKIPEDWWDIPAIPPMSKERVGYPTQKPLALLEKIILSSTKEGDVILDPFCGCGTAIIAAERLNRYWIGIDITHIAIATIKERLYEEFKKIPQVTGEPYDLEGAIELAGIDRYQFQIWALSLLGKVNLMKKGADGGIDGIKYFQLDEDNERLFKTIIQVKSGKVSVKDIRELNSVVQREKALLGLLVTLNRPTRNMVKEAASYGIIETAKGDKYPTIQIVEVEDLLKHKITVRDLMPD